MKLKKIKEDHYVIVDHSEINVGDFVYVDCSELEVKEIRKVSDYYNEQYLFEGGGQIHIDYCKKITHSTQPLEDFIDNEGIKRIGWVSIKVLELSEVKKLIGEVDVEKMALVINPIELIQGWDKKKEYRENWISGYNQAVEDNKDKKYTDTDLFKILLDFIEFQHPHHEPRGSIIERFVKTRQPKTEWEVDFFDGKLGFKK